MDRYARLPTEAVLPAARALDVLSTRQIVALMAREERRSVAAVARAAPQVARAAALAARAIGGGGRIIYVGAGTSGRLAALDAAECPPTFGTRPAQVVAVVAGGTRALRQAVEGAEDDEAAARRRLARLQPTARDVVIGIAASGVTPFARAALAAARTAGAATVLITCAAAAARAAGARADVVVGLAVGPEVLAGSTRLKAGTATKLVLNAISTAAMVRTGRCYGARMVDLRATNAKLRARARRIVGELTDVADLAEDGAADRLLRAAGGHVKVAIVMARSDLSRRQAERALAAAGGRLRDVINNPPAGRSGPRGATRSKRK